MLVGPLLAALLAEQQCIALDGQDLCVTVHFCATEPLSSWTSGLLEVHCGAGEVMVLLLLC